MNKPDETYINIATEEARKAMWPFGAVLVRNGEIIAQAGSGDHKDIPTDPTAHAEVNVIRRACEKLKSGDLSGAILYASCEPCALCFGAAWYAGITEIVYGMSIEDADKINNSEDSNLEFPHDHVAKTGIHVVGGIARDEVIKMYSSHPRVTKRGK